MRSLSSLLRGASALSVVVLAAACAEQQAVAPTEPKPPVEARAAVDRAVATTGDVLTFQITVDHDPTYEVVIPETGARISGFRIIDTERTERQEASGRQVQELTYRLRADLVGSYILPSVAVGFRPVETVVSDSETSTGTTEGELEGVLETSEIFVEVESVLPEDGSAEDILDLKPLRPIQSDRSWWWAALAGGALVAAVLVWLYLRRRGPAPLAPPEPAHEVAFRALDALRATDFTDPAAVRRYYFSISETIRDYVEGRFGLNATDLTTEEIRVRLPQIEALRGDDREGLMRFLQHTDQVKFAEYQPSEDEIEGTYEAALRFVESTQPVADEGEADEELAA